MTNWKRYKLEEISSKLGDGLHGTPVYDEKGEYFFINGSNLVDGKVLINLNTKRVKEDQYNKYKKELSERTILLGINGTIGNVALFNNEKCILGKSACYINVDTKFDRNFMKYVFLNDDFQNYIKANATGSVIKNVGLKLLRDYEVVLPADIETQSRIASILSSFDDKIELNRRMNQTLEHMAQALFNHYFVDNIDPDNLPEEWKWGALGDLIEIKHGYAFKGEYFTEEDNEDILLTPGNFKIGGGFNYKKFKYYIGSVPFEYILKTGDLIVTMTDLSKDGDTLGYSSLVPRIQGKNLLHNQRIGKIIFKEDDIFKFYCYWLLRTDDYRNFILGGATGSTVKHTSPSRIHEYECIIPSHSTLEEFSNQVQTMYQKELSNELESNTLSNIRDTLLPKLMSGEIDLDAINNEEAVINKYGAIESV